MDRSGVERAVLVQMNGQADNEYKFEAVRRFPDLTVASGGAQPLQATQITTADVYR
jgi:hypothetical protein